jgi:hypothetical protein
LRQIFHVSNKKKKKSWFVGTGEPAAPALEPSQVRPFQAIPLQPFFLFFGIFKERHFKSK